MLYFIITKLYKPNSYNTDLLLRQPGQALSNIVYQLKSNAQKYPDKWALVSDNEVYTYRKYFDTCVLFARSLIATDLKARDSVAILGNNSAEWFISHLGSIMAGCIPAGIYIYNSPIGCDYILKDTKAKVIIVDGMEQMKKIINQDLKGVKAVVIYGDYQPDLLPKVFQAKIYSWFDFLNLGLWHKYDRYSYTLAYRFATLHPHDICSYIYTSGTEGMPKGIEISNLNIMWTVDQLLQKVPTDFGNERFISYLPLNHIMGQMLDMYLPISTCGTVYFAGRDAIRGNMIDKLKQIKPTIFAGVPRVWEKIKERIEKHVDNSLFFSADVKAQLGLDECRLPIVSGAPSSITMLQWFYDHNMPLYEIYGLSETAGPITISQPGEYRLGSVGKPLPGIKIKILSDQNQSNLPNLEGEILVKGNCVFSGYLNKPEDTDKAFCDNSGVSVEGNRSWFRTGDIGYYDNEGFLFITGRIKEILITAGGEKVAPELLEEKIKEELPIVSDAMIVGDRQKFLSAVIALKVKFIDGKPTNQLHESAVQALEKIGVFAPTVEDAVNDERVIYYIQAGIDRVNKSRQSWYERIQKWTVVGGEFTVYSGELTPTLKLKREFVYNKYKKEIRDMYS